MIVLCCKVRDAEVCGEVQNVIKDARRWFWRWFWRWRRYCWRGLDRHDIARLRRKVERLFGP